MQPVDKIMNIKMKKTLLIVAGFLISFGFGFYLKTIMTNQPQTNTTLTIKPLVKNNSIKLGAFSVSLNVKDLHASKEFYENFGFSVFAGSMPQNYLIMKNENALIGLFQGMFQGNMLTFNPGWNENAKNIHYFDDVRTIQKHLKDKNIKLISEADPTTTGPASLMVTDLDGNILLIDQHR